MNQTTKLYSRLAALVVILTGMFAFIVEPVSAAVPVEVVRFQSGTEFEHTLEEFMFDLFTTLQRRNEDFTAAFELQKIEKAREDVNKLILSVQQELKDRGTVRNITDPVTKADMVIFQPGRIIHNVDDFLYEEPIQKARDFLYCVFGGNLTVRPSLGLDPLGPPPNNTWIIYPWGKTRAESLELQKKLRDELLSRIQRKAKYKVTAPPEYWYIRDMCERIMGSFPIRSECFDAFVESGGVETPECPTKATTNLKPTLTQSLTSIKGERGYFTLDEMLKTISHPMNTYQGARNYLWQNVKTIIGQYAGLRMAEYLAGQGIKPERAYLSLSVAEDDGGGVITARDYMWDTDYVVSPAVLLLQKTQAATQAQFDLAQKAYLNFPAFLGDARPGLFESYNLTLSDNVEISNGGTFQRSLDRWVRPNVDPPGSLGIASGTLQYRSIPGGTVQGGLPAPWEDTNTYGLTGGILGDPYKAHQFMLPNSSITQPTIDLLPEAKALRLFPSYRWYQDVYEMYQYGVPIEVGSESNSGWVKLLKKWFEVVP